MAANKNNILISGGRRLKLSTDMNEGNEGIRLTKNDDTGDWDIVIKTRIQKIEAEKTIFKFNDLNPKVPTAQTFDEAFPNMVYLTALDDDGKSVDMSFYANSELIASFDKSLGGSITIKINLLGMGKTENPKTENPEVGP
jgi:hypothetical protein